MHSTDSSQTHNLHDVVFVVTNYSDGMKVLEHFKAMQSVVIIVACRPHCL